MTQGIESCGTLSHVARGQPECLCRPQATINTIQHRHASSRTLPLSKGRSRGPTNPVFCRITSMAGYVSSVSGMHWIDKCNPQLCSHIHSRSPSTGCCDSLDQHQNDLLPPQQLLFWLYHLGKPSSSFISHLQISAAQHSVDGSRFCPLTPLSRFSIMIWSLSKSLRSLSQSISSASNMSTNVRW